MASEKWCTLNKELLFLILQFCKDEGYKNTAHMFEQESGCYFDMVFFEDLVLNGKWNMVEKYLSGFTSVSDNKYSTKIYFEIRKLNFLEALDNNDHAKALDILRKDLKVFSEENEELYREMTQLLTLDDLREHELLSTYEDAESSRKILMHDLKKLIELNPVFRGKLKFPVIESRRLRCLINQSLNWQHIQCHYPQPNPDIETLFKDHVCQWPQNHLFLQSTDNLLQDASLPVFPSRWFSGPSTATHSVSGEEICVSGPITSDNIGDSHAMPQSQKSLVGTEYEVASTILHPGQNHSPESIVSDELPIISMNNGMLQNIEPIGNIGQPKAVARILNELSPPMSMDFHPVDQTFLLVGTNVGDIGLWDVNSGVKKLSRNFMVWNIGACSATFKTAMMKDPCMSVNRVAWSPNGSFFGVAFSKHIVQLYSYHDDTDVQQKLEIDAHVGGVNDLAFSAPSKQHVVITGGDDKLIKVWDVITGVQMHNFEGHEAPVYSLLPHCKDDIHFIFSTSVDGKIKAWLYDNMGPRVHIDAPGLACTTMAYSADNRLFSCGTNQNGESFLVEWNESEGDAKRTYQGLRKNSSTVVQFSPIKKFLAAADDHVIKIWDMDKVEHLTSIDAGDLPANPHIRFNKDQTLLAVTASENKIKILVPAYGLQLLNASVTCFADSTSDVSDAPRKDVINPSSSVAGSGEADGHVPTNCVVERIKDEKNKIIDKSNNKSDVSKIIQISKPSQCKSLLLGGYGEADKISCLMYTNAGNAILALASNATHLLWKWPQNDLNSSGKATTNVPPQLWQPKSGSLTMTNDITGSMRKEAVPCFALSRNDTCLLSASGGIISLFNMLTFKRMMPFMRPSPAATSLAFHPLDNNIVAIGMDDSTILIYDVFPTKVKSKLKGHSGRVTGLAFSTAMNVLVSSGADAQIFTWDLDRWGKCKSKLLQFPDERTAVTGSNTLVQFHQDQVHFLVVHETQLSIYEARELARVHQWIPEDSTKISQATFSCDSQMVYACFVDGKVSIFDASDLVLKCHILPSSYLPSTARLNVRPNAIAAHPQKPTQFAVGLTDGAIIVFEPRKPGNSCLLGDD
ncbi:TOPLESS-related 1 [Hibiscus trionum]|uniref:TOPLESS-related 1 n=1 Tax=Hibiscus trionum TaxID=183268 RepID=A0A9W7MK66_HIBTR|nr:TOPLESS-related 1 [Hibiscus trionum]